MNKKFWKTCKPFFSTKDTPSEKMTLVENGEVLSDDIDIAECMNDYFINITETLNIRKWPGDNSNNQNEDIVNKAIFKYKNHPSIKMIKDKLGEVDNKFEFQHILPEIVYKQVRQLPQKVQVEIFLPK